MIYITTLSDNKFTYDIKIRLDDRCKNGHEDFIINGEYPKDLTIVIKED